MQTRLMPLRRIAEKRTPQTQEVDAESCDEPPPGGVIEAPLESPSPSDDDFTFLSWSRHYNMDQLEEIHLMYIMYQL